MVEPGDGEPGGGWSMAGMLEAAATSVPITVELALGSGVAGLYVDPGVAEAVAFLVGEGLRNTWRHSGAEAAAVRVDRVGAGELRVEVSDDGVGFLPDEAAGAGLVRVDRRLRDVGSVLAIDSRPWCGTRLVAVVPIVPVAPKRV